MNLPQEAHSFLLEYTPINVRPKYFERLVTTASVRLKRLRWFPKQRHVFLPGSLKMIRKKRSLLRIEKAKVKLISIRNDEPGINLESLNVP